MQVAAMQTSAKGGAASLPASLPILKILTLHHSRPVLLFFALFVLLGMYFNARRLVMYSLASRYDTLDEMTSASWMQTKPSPVPSAIFSQVLRLNAGLPHKCLRALFLRTPKTGSSSIAALFFAKNALAGKKCDTGLFRLRYYSNDTYTVKSEVLEGVPQATLDRHHLFVAHMNYTTKLRTRLNLSSLYRVTAVRAPLARIESYLTYEVDRPYVEMESALEYIAHNRKVLFDHRANFSSAVLEEVVDEVVKDYPLIIVTEFIDHSLAVLVHDLRWRVPDAVAPRMNALSALSRARNLSRSRANRLAQENGPERLRWILNVDRLLYSRCVAELRKKFQALPPLYQQIPGVLRQLRENMEMVCKTERTRKHFSAREKECMRRFRERVVKEVMKDK